MVIITQRQRIQNVRMAWYKQFFVNGQWTYGSDKEDIYNQLSKLDLNTVDTSVIDTIIGNNTWTTNICWECLEWPDVVAILGNSGNSTQLCLDCLNKAVAALKAAQQV